MSNRYQSTKPWNWADMSELNPVQLTNQRQDLTPLSDNDADVCEFEIEDNGPKSDGPTLDNRYRVTSADTSPDADHQKQQDVAEVVNIIDMNERLDASEKSITTSGAYRALDAAGIELTEDELPNLPGDIFPDETVEKKLQNLTVVEFRNDTQQIQAHSVVDQREADIHPMPVARGSVQGQRGRKTLYKRTEEARRKFIENSRSDKKSDPKYSNDRIGNNEACKKAREKKRNQKDLLECIARDAREDPRAFGNLVDKYPQLLDQQFIKLKDENDNENRTVGKRKRPSQ